MLSAVVLLCCGQLCAVAVGDSALLLGLLCMGFAVCGAVAKAFLGVSSKTLTEAGSGGAGAGGSGMGAAVRGTGAGQRGYQDSGGAAAVGLQQKAKKMGERRRRRYPPSSSWAFPRRGVARAQRGGTLYP